MIAIASIKCILCTENVQCADRISSLVDHSKSAELKRCPLQDISAGDRQFPFKEYV